MGWHYGPDLNPAEWVWCLAKHHRMANHAIAEHDIVQCAPDIDAMREAYNAHPDDLEVAVARRDEVAVGLLGPLVLAKTDVIGWALLGDDKRYRFLATPKDNPDLFRPAVRVAPTALGDIVYFGTWAADIRTRHVLWRLPVKELYYPAVPLDRMVLVIDGNRRVRAFRPRRSAP